MSFTGDGPDLQALCAQGRLDKTNPQHLALIDAMIRYYGDNPEGHRLSELYGVHILPTTTTDSTKVVQVKIEPVAPAPTPADKKKAAKQSTNEVVPPPIDEFALPPMPHVESF